MRRAGVLASSGCMMSFSRSTQALFWITRLVRLSPLASTAPLRTNFSPGFKESFSGISIPWLHAPPNQRASPSFVRELMARLVNNLLPQRRHFLLGVHPKLALFALPCAVFKG